MPPKRNYSRERAIRNNIAGVRRQRDVEDSEDDEGQNIPNPNNMMMMMMPPPQQQQEQIQREQRIERVRNRIQFLLQEQRNALLAGRYHPLGNWRIGANRPASAVSWMFSIRLSNDPRATNFFSMHPHVDENGEQIINYRPMDIEDLQEPMQARGARAARAMPVFLVYQLERGNNGNVIFGEGFHYQGYIEFSDRVTAPEIIDIMQWQDFWWDVWLEPRRGSKQAAIDYVTKEETRVMHDFGVAGVQPLCYIRQGEPRAEDAIGQGVAVQQMIADGANFAQVAAAYPEYALRNANGIGRLINERVKSMPKKFRQVTCYVYWGDTRTGKSRTVYEKEGYDKVYSKLANSAYYDGYEMENHEALLLEEFNAGDMKIDDFLKVLDGQPLMLNVKFASASAHWKRVYITSNVPPSEWFPRAPKKQIEALYARLMTGGITKYVDASSEEAMNDHKYSLPNDQRDVSNVLFVKTK